MDNNAPNTDEVKRKKVSEEDYKTDADYIAEGFSSGASLCCLK